jgi:ribonucleoside-diphosphate reductase alpha chain
MQVVKRDGTKEPVMFDKITARIRKMCYGLNAIVEPIKVAMRVIEGLYDGVTTSELDSLAAEIAATMSTAHPDYGKLAARIAVSNLHKNTKKSFSETMTDLYQYENPRTGRKAPLLSDEVYDIIQKNAEKLNSTIIYSRDFNYDFFGFRTLERSYLTKLNGRIVERPQHMLMRVAVGIHLDDIDEAITTYELMSKQFFIHASPTLFNAGAPKPQMASSFVLQVQEDSIDGIYNTLKQTAQISQSAGGIGLSIQNVRATGSYIKGTNGTSNGIVPMLKVFNDTACYVNQGGGKRKGSFAVYIEPWHADILEFLDLKSEQAKDLFYGMWISDLFMKRVEQDGNWTLMCPDECPHLYDTYGDEFEKLYEGYEKVNKGRKTIKARFIWERILTSQIETGAPYMMYKDHINRKSNHKNLGVIRSSNLCGEIMEYTSENEVTSCNLASISLPKFIAEKETGEKFFNHQELYKVAKKVVRNLDTIIDRNHYPIEEAKNSSLNNRAVGLGVQGLADVFIVLRWAYTSEESKRLNQDIFETLYYAALESSMEMAKETEAPYPSYLESPMAEGQFQFNLWGIQEEDFSGNWDWKKLRENIVKYGVKNSLLVALMPTVSTSLILGNNQSFEPYTSNIYKRRVLSGEFVVVNKHLLEDLVQLNLWDNNMKEQMLRADGSIQQIEKIPQNLKEIYQTVWEMDTKDIIDMTRQRGYFVDQSQSLNLFIKDPDLSKLTATHFYAWKSGLKTGMFYLNTKSAVDGTYFSLTSERETEREGDPINAEEFNIMVDVSKNIRPDTIV